MRPLNPVLERCGTYPFVRLGEAQRGRGRAGRRRHRLRGRASRARRRRRSSARRSARRDRAGVDLPAGGACPSCATAIADWVGAPLRRDARPRHRGRPDARHQGGRSSPWRRWWRRGGRDRTTPGYPVAVRGALFAGARGGRAAAARRPWLPARPRRARPASSRACDPVAQLPQQPDRARPPRSASYGARPRWPASTASCWPATRPTASCGSAGTRRTAPAVATARNVLVSTRCPSARRCRATAPGSWPATGLIAALKRYRPNVGVAPQEFVQRAAIAAWSDEAHVVAVRDRYRAKRDVLLPALEALGLRDAGGPRRSSCGCARRPASDDEACAARCCEQRHRLSRPDRSSARPARATCAFALVPTLGALRARGGAARLS